MGPDQYLSVSESPSELMPFSINQDSDILVLNSSSPI
jgi:hypothetical protein